MYFALQGKWSPLPFIGVEWDDKWDKERYVQIFAILKLLSQLYDPHAPPLNLEPELSWKVFHQKHKKGEQTVKKFLHPRHSNRF